MSRLRKGWKRERHRERQKEAKDHQKRYNSLTDEEKLASLEKRGHGHCSEAMALRNEE